MFSAKSTSFWIIQWYFKYVSKCWLCFQSNFPYWLRDWSVPPLPPAPLCLLALGYWSQWFMYVRMPCTCCAAGPHPLIAVLSSSSSSSYSSDICGRIWYYCHLPYTYVSTYIHTHVCTYIYIDYSYIHIPGYIITQ